MKEATLASFVSTLDRSDIPDEVAARGSLIIADTVGAILGGASDPIVSSLTRAWTAENGGQATILGTAGERTSAYRAAFVNATAGTVLELDEGHRFAAGHPAIHVLPALLADGESSYRSGDELLTAFVAGYEAAVRVAGMVVPLADGIHPHGVWGGVGTAAAVARLRELAPDTTLNAMRIAANYAQHTRFEAATDGATVRNSYAGMSNLSGIIAVEQAEAGFTGLEDGIALHLSSVAAVGPNRDALTDRLGERWEIERGYFKIHAACRYTHAVLDAVETLAETQELDTADVETVRVETYPAAASLSNARPKNALQAKFSIPFAVASALATGDTGKLSFTDEALTEEALALAERVEVTATEEFASRVPDERGARVTIETVSDDTFTHTVRTARGGEHAPFSDAELRTKFDHLVAPVIGEGSIDGLWTAARKPAAPRVLCALTRA